MLRALKVAALRRNLADLGPSNGRLVVGGDSAGGNLAAGCALDRATAGEGDGLAPACRSRTTTTTGPSTASPAAWA